MATGDLTGVRIDAREIYDAVLRLTGRVDVLIEQHQATRTDVADHEDRIRVIEDARPGPRIADLDRRLRSVEARQWPIPAASLLIALAALVVGLLPKIS